MKVNTNVFRITIEKLKNGKTVKSVSKKFALSSEDTVSEEVFINISKSYYVDAIKELTGDKK